MKEIQGHAKTVQELLTSAKYAIDFYQREYKWEKKQVDELIEDLTARFLEDYDPEDERSAVADYGHYFLGSIIISDKQQKKFIVDGQQRLTTLTLLLIYLNNLQRALPEKERVDINLLIFSQKHGKKSFNLDVDERVACMEALFAGQEFEDTDRPESVQRICARYHDIQDGLPEEIDIKALPYFIDWVIENVHLVEITAYADEDAYTIFETMNDRGLSLTPTEMLKGFLLANIEDSKKRAAADTLIKRRISELTDYGKDADADCFKAWLRSQYADTIRERKKGAQPGEFDRIGTEFHRWVRENREKLGLNGSSGYLRWVETDFDFYSRHYLRLMKASTAIAEHLEPVFYLSQHGFTSQYHVLLAPLSPEDSEDVALKKMRLVGVFLDILVHRRIWNFKSINYKAMQYTLFVVMRDIRRATLPKLRKTLKQKLDQDDLSFENAVPVYLNQWNSRYLHRILARITDFVETQSGQASRYLEYTERRGKNRYEIEHIWASKPERHQDEFAHPAEFSAYRDRLGDLLLLPKSFNASYGDSPYKTKLKHYNAQNLLARSLNEACYEKNPGFKRFLKQSGLPFCPYPQFKKTDLDERQELYNQIAARIWDPARISMDRDA